MASSIDAIPAKKLEELLECSFCLETLNDPRTLPCFHSFCKCCLEKFVQGQGNRDENPDQGIKNFECPICRSEFTVDPKEGAAGIGTNYFIRNMLDVMEVESRVKGIPCVHCENPSVARCVTCDVFLCEKCLEGHNNYVGFQHHSVLSMDELSEPKNRFKIRGTPRCKEHDEALKHFCETCEELICRDCKDYNHTNHKCLPLEKAAEQKTEELNNHYRKLTEEVTEVNNALEAMKGVDKSLEANVKTAKQKISARKEEILEAVRRNLDEKEKSLLREIDMIHHFRHEAIEEQLKDTKAYVKKIQNSVDMCAGLLRNGNPVEIASSHKQVCTNMVNVRKERPENLKPDNDGAIPFNSCATGGLDAEIDKISQRMGTIKTQTSSNDCPICQSPVTNPKSLRCRHIFCKPCIEKAFTLQKKCPVCQVVYGITEGDQPDGTMRVSRNYYQYLPGYEGYGTYVITYDIPSGKQGNRHPKPGHWFHGTSRQAYLPATREGEVVLKLLQKAFDKKLIFTVGRSTTTGMENCVTWNDIHHKTSISGGPQRNPVPKFRPIILKASFHVFSSGFRFGYPDPGYLARVKDELKAKGIVPE